MKRGRSGLVLVGRALAIRIESLPTPRNGFRRTAGLHLKPSPPQVPFPIYLNQIPTIFRTVYKHTLGFAGLHYIALGMGVAIASQANAWLMDPIYMYLKKRNGGIDEPEFRLPSMMVGSVFLRIVPQIAVTSLLLIVLRTQMSQLQSGCLLRTPLCLNCLQRKAEGLSKLNR